MPLRIWETRRSEGVMRGIVGILWLILMVFIILVVLNIPGIRWFPVPLRNILRDVAAVVVCGTARPGYVRKGCKATRSRGGTITGRQAGRL
jgi:hypothetical protein